MDAAWVDNIVFPSSMTANPEMVTGTNALEFLLRPGETGQSAIHLSNDAEGSLLFTADPAGIQPSQPAYGNGSRNIEGSYLVCNGEKFHTGEVYTWNYRTYNAGSDNEWIKQVYITFPFGLETTAATDFVGGSGGDMVFQGELGNGATAHWFGQDANNWGVVHMGETAACDVTMYTHNEILEDVSLHYEVMGEVYGGPPHTVSGDIPLRNLGPVIPWMTASDTAGFLSGHDSDSLVITVDATGLEDGTYHAWILMQDNFNHEITVPVTMTVDQFLGMGENAAEEESVVINVFPNPSDGPATIDIRLDRPSKATLSIFDVRGQSIRTLYDLPSSKKHIINWDGRDNGGNPLPEGIYFIKVMAGSEFGSSKLIIVK